MRLSTGCRILALAMAMVAWNAQAIVVNSSGVGLGTVGVVYEGNATSASKAAARSPDGHDHPEDLR